MKPVFLLLIILSSLSCSIQKQAAGSPDSLMQTDIAFSNLSKQKGMKAAFLAYIDDGGVLLRPDHYPIVGANAASFLQGVPDSSFTLTWQPQAADIAKSGDMGYTYGVYTLTEKDTTLQGTYVTVWKQSRSGSWKFVLDTGNPGVGK